ncbi:hypothetical protein D3C75_1048990 [compost metagenome]
MNIQERHDKLLQDARALRHFYSIEDKPLYEAFAAFNKAFTSTEHVTTDEFEALLNAVDERIERLCIDRKITEEFLEVLIEGNEEDLKQYRIYSTTN